MDERHGQVESLPSFLDIVQRLIDKGERSLVGRVTWNSKQDALDASLEGKRSATGPAHSLIDSVFYWDIARALGRLRTTAKFQITVVTIATCTREIRRDQARATAIKPHLVSGRYDHAVILVGNLHAILKTRWGEGSLPKTPF